MVMNKSFGTLCSAVALLALAPAARAETRATMDVSAGARAGTNPYLVSGSSTGAVAGTIEVSPVVTTSNGTSTLRLDSGVRFDRYLRRYADDLSARAGLTFDKRFSEQTQLTVGGVFSTSMGGARDLFRPELGNGAGLGSGTPGAGGGIGSGQGGLIDPTADVTVTGARFRQYNYGANARLGARLSSRGQLSLGGGANFFDSASSIGQPFSQYVADVGYNRILNGRSQVGVQLAYSKVDYRQRIAGDGDVITPSLTGTFKLSETMSLTGRAGVSLSSIRQLNGTRAKDTAFAGQVSLCRNGEYSTFCLSGNRNVQATSLGGVSTVTTVSLSHSWRMSERDTLTTSANYGQTEQPAASAAQFGTNRTKLALASAVYLRRISERLFLTVSPQYEKAWGQPVKRNANVAGMIGLRYRFGQ